MSLLTRLDGVPANVQVPRYNRDERGVGIVHIGLGAFMRAHLAIYTDDALSLGQEGWRIACVGLRSRDAVDAINAQAGLYTLLVRDAATSARIPGSIAYALHAPSQPHAVMEVLTAETTRIVSLTITEKGYGIDPATGGLDTANPVISADLASDLTAPRSAVGLIVAGLTRRRVEGTGPFTVLCCDNLPENGTIVRRLVLEFAQFRDAALAVWIENHVTFPSTMVDRITPQQSEKTRTDAHALVGVEDQVAIETEPFSQWVIEDRFCAGRPSWDKAGAVMVEDVHPYERMKLVMLNGTHSMLAYSGFLSGHQFVRHVMADPKLSRLVNRHLIAAAATLDPVPGIDLNQYREALLARFANPAIDHPTYQIAMDGTQKMPTRIFNPALAALEKSQDISSFAFATAVWMAYVAGSNGAGSSYSLRDPRAAELTSAVQAADRSTREFMNAIFNLPGLLPPPLAAASEWQEAVHERLVNILDRGIRAAVEAEANSSPDGMAV